MSELGTVLTWSGIVLCVLHSAMFSGLNLALFGISRLRLEIEASNHNQQAIRVLQLRNDANFLLSSVLWGNVAINCLLTLLSESVLAGVGAFFFSTVVITFAGEIFPQAYFSRNSLRMGSLLSPVLRLYQRLLYPVAKPTALVLDWFLGREGIEYFRERDLRKVIKKHVDAAEADLGRFEGIGALNFLALDDLAISEEGEPVNPKSILTLDVNVDLPVIPEFANTANDPFVASVEASGKKWVVLTSPQNEPLLVLDADGFLRRVLFSSEPFNPYVFCHRPLVVRDAKTPLGEIIRRLSVQPENAEDDVVDKDLILLWGRQKRIVTGADLLGRILRGIVPRGP